MTLFGIMKGAKTVHIHGNNTNLSRTNLFFLKSKMRNEDAKLKNKAYQEKQEVLVVQCTNTIDDPNTMVIHFEHTPPTY